MSQETEKVVEVSAPMDLEPSITTASETGISGQVAPESQPNEIKVFSAPVASTSVIDTPTDEGESSSKPCTSDLMVSDGRSWGRGTDEQPS